MAHVEDNIHSRPRTTGSKSVARRLRASGWVPAVAYGPNIKARHLAIDPKTFLLARREHGAAHVYNVQVEGEDSFKALVKQVDRNPVSRELTHIDLFAIDMSKPVKVKVRVELKGKARGVIEGGSLQQIQRRIEIACLPDNMPAKIEVDVSDMAMGDTLHLSDLNMPEGVKTTAADDEAVAILVAAEGVEEPAADTETTDEPAKAEGKK